MDGFTVLHVGMDGLDVSFQGALPLGIVAELERAKAEAQAQGREVLAYIGPKKFPLFVAQQGAQGGYAFRCDSGFDGETWFFKRSQDIQDWNIRVSVKSLPLATLGYKRTVARLWNRLDALGARIVAESVSRVDFCADFMAPGFELDPDQFVAHWRCRRRTHAAGKAKAAAFSEDPEEIIVHHSARKVTSVTIGTMPNRQLIVYDKRREAIDQRKAHWFDIWGKALGKDGAALKADKALRVWRVEVRAGKNFLLDFGLRTFADLDAMAGDVLRVSLEQVRYLDAADARQNVSRRRDARIWDETRVAMLDVLAANEEHVAPSRIRVGKRREIQSMYRAMMAGFAASYAVALGLDGDSEELITQKVAADLAAFIRDNRARFQASKRRAGDRLYFIAEHHDNGTDHRMARPVAA